MGNCIPSRLRGASARNCMQGCMHALRSKKMRTCETPSRIPGVLSNEAVTWFIERDKRTFVQSISFVPAIIQNGILCGTVTESTSSVVVYRGDGAVVFCDASGFTKLTEYLAEKPNGAELLSNVLNRFFTPLIEIISAYRGDIIKFSGDALTILFVKEDETFPESEHEVPCGSGWAGCSGHSPLELAVLRSIACCLEIHKRLDDFDTGIPGRTLSFHIGIGCGNCVVLHVGGEASPEDSKTKRFEFVLCGEPLEQIAHACHYAEVYETVVSPQAWDLVRETVVEGSPILEDITYKKITGLVTSKHTYATIRAAAEQISSRETKSCLKMTDMNLTRRYIPSAVFQQMANDTLVYVNEIRNVTVFFICVPGLDVSSPKGAGTAQDLMQSVQQACFAQEGQVNKFLVDDKGLLFLCVFGTPPMVHTDDPLRAIFACFEIIQSVRRLGLVGNFGLSTGRVFCGIVGSSLRQEYTILGDSVNCAARFMQLGQPNIILTDQTTYDQTRGYLDYKRIEPVQLKGKSIPMEIYQPMLSQIMHFGNDPAEKRKNWNVGTPHPFVRKGTNILDIIGGGAGTVLDKDPLLQCSQWRELKLLRNILDEPPVGSSGGTIILAGRSGLGKDHLCQQIIETSRRIRPETVAVYATEQGQPRERMKPVLELIETCIAVAVSLRLVDEASENKLQCLAHLTGVSLADLSIGLHVDEETGMIGISQPHREYHFDVTALPNAMLPTSGVRYGGDFPLQKQENERVSFLDDQYIRYCELLVSRILRAKPVVLVLTVSKGTSLFNVVDNPTFWGLLSRMSYLSYASSNVYPLKVVLLCGSVDIAAANIPPQAQTIDLHPLNRNCLQEYVSKILKLDSEGTNNIPNELIDFIEDLTRGNPLYVLETLEQLVAKQYISRSTQGYVTVNCDLHKDVSLTDWSHTSMVGRVICQLEALAPQEAAIVKMASVFQGPFSVLDIAASLKSAYVNATRFDNYRMYRTIARLSRVGIISEIPHLPEYANPEGTRVPVNDMSRFPKDTDKKFIQAMNKIPMFILDSFLIRKVARGMILQHQALTVKRQAMLSRVIVKDLPSRIEERRRRRESLHMPYYNLVKL